jgi:asparagine synthase (glutamine-hydrolysing)
MCGIAGVIQTSSSKDGGKKIDLMLELMENRGPDSMGIYKSGCVNLGHRRLSIVDLSNMGKQPMTFKNRAIIVFNGEIYNFKKIKKKLINKGYKFKSHSDTEVLLLGYVEFGKDILKMIDGFYSFCIFDIRNNKLFCARDPFGKKPFYYSLINNEFVFSSGIEPTIKASNIRPTVNYDGLSHYLLKGYYEPGLTAYNDILTLKAGCYLEFDIDSKVLEIHKFNIPVFDQGKIDIDADSSVELSENLLRKAVKNRLLSDVPLGILLSGGVDSSLIALLMAENTKEKINAFTISFEDEVFDESIYSKKIAEKLPINHVINKVGHVDLQLTLAKLVKVYGEPFGDTSTIPTYQVFKSVRKKSKVVLTGDGSDEVFGGYIGTDLYLFRDKFQHFFKHLSFLFMKWPEKLLNSKIGIMRKASHAAMALRIDGSDAFYSLYRGGWTKDMRKKCMRSDGFRKTKFDKPDGQLKLKYKMSGKNDMERYLNLNLERMTEGFLVKIDRASMDNSIEVRSPMLDLKMFDFIRKIPKNSLFIKGIRKGIPKKILERSMGKAFVNRRKMGFSPPLSNWLREEKVAEWMLNKLTNPGGIVYELFSPIEIKKLIDNHMDGYDHSTRLWYLLFLEEWHDQYIRT